MQGQPYVVKCSVAISACEIRQQRAEPLKISVRGNSQGAAKRLHKQCCHQCLALQLFSDMGSSLQPDVITHNAAVSACEKGDQRAEALQLLADMQKSNLQPSVITYSADISTCHR